LTSTVLAVDNTPMKSRGRIKPIAPPTLIALALIMAAGAPVDVSPQAAMPIAAEQARVLRENRDGEQVAQLLAAINAAAHKVQPRPSHAAVMTRPCGLAAALATSWPAPPVQSSTPPTISDAGRLHLIDLPPPAPRA
jgi:hypothetical protein